MLDNNILQSIGLTLSEQGVYIEGLRAGTSTSASIIKATGMPRPTVMAALKSLVEYGVCQTSELDKKSFLYTMLPPEHFKSYIGSRMRQLDGIADSLSLASFATNKSTILTNEVVGQDAVQGLLELALRCKSRQWQIIAPHKNALSYMPKEYINYFKRVRSDRQIESQSLWEQSSMTELMLKDVLMRKPRYVSENIASAIPTLMIAFDDCLLAVDMPTKKSQPTAVLLQSSHVVKTFNILFEMAWRSAIKN